MLTFSERRIYAGGFSPLMAVRNPHSESFPYLLLASRVASY